MQNATNAEGCWYKHYSNVKVMLDALQSVYGLALRTSHAINHMDMKNDNLEKI